MTKPERNGKMYSTKIGYIAYIAEKSTTLNKNVRNPYMEWRK